MSVRKIATSTFWQMASQITMAGLSILTVKFVAIGLSKELAGNYNSAYGFLQLFGILADFGLYAVSVREVSRASNKEDVLGALIILRSIILTASLVVALTFVWIVPTWKGTPLPLSVTIASLVPFFTLLAGIIRTVFQVHYKMHFVFIAEVLQRILTVSLIGTFIAMGIRGSTDLHILHLFLFIGGIGAFLLFFLSLFFGNKLVRIRPRWNTDALFDLFKKALPYGLAFLCIAAYRQLDVTLIALLRPDYELQNAYYGFVLRMAEVGFLIPTFLLNSTLPILSENNTDEDAARRLLGKVLLIILTIGSVSLLFSALWSRPLIQLMTTEAYLSTPLRPGSDTALRLMALPMFFNGIVLYGFYVLLHRFEWRRLVSILLLGVVLSLALNFTFIPSHGFVGAATTSIVVHIFLAALLLFEGLRSAPVTFSIRTFIRWMLFSVLLGYGLFISAPLLQSEWHTIAGLAFASVGMAFLAWMTGIWRILLR